MPAPRTVEWRIALMVTCNFHAGVASNQLGNLYFLEANEAVWKSRRFVGVASTVGDADDGVSGAGSRYDCRRA